VDFACAGRDQTSMRRRVMNSPRQRRPMASSISHACCASATTEMSAWPLRAAEVDCQRSEMTYRGYVATVRINASRSDSRTAKGNCVRTKAVQTPCACPAATNSPAAAAQIRPGDSGPAQVVRTSSPIDDRDIAPGAAENPGQELPVPPRPAMLARGCDLRVGTESRRRTRHRSPSRSGEKCLRTVHRLSTEFSGTRPARRSRKCRRHKVLAL